MFPEWFEKNRYFVLFIFLIYSFLVFVFHGFGINLFSTVLATGDAFIAGYPSKIFASRFSLWNPYIQCGTFNIKDIGFQGVYPPGLLIMKMLPSFFGYNLFLLLHYTLAGFFTFLFLRKLDLNSTASFLGGLSFMFCGFLSAHKGHHQMISAAIWLPLVLYFVERFFQQKHYRELIFAGIALSLSILADYISIPMYIGMIVFPFILFKVFLKDKSIKNRSVSYKLYIGIKTTALIYGIGLLLGAVTLLPIGESLGYVTRQSVDYKFFTSYSFRWKFLPMIIFPFFYGTSTPGFYPIEYFVRWNLTEMTGYMGILPLVSAFLCFSVYRKKNSIIYFWSIVAILAFVLVLGSSTPFYKIMFYIPVYNMFRVPARNWFEVNFAVSVLFSYFINYIMSEKEIGIELSKKIKKSIKYLSIFTAIIIIVVIIVNIIAIKISAEGSASWIMRKTSNPEAAFEQLHLFTLNNNLFPPAHAIYIPLLLICLTCVILFLLRKYYNKKLFWFFVASLLFFDLFSFGHFHDSGYENQQLLSEINKNEIFSFLKTRETDLSTFRIYPLEKKQKLIYPEINMLYGLSTFNGYNSIWLKDFSYLTGFNPEGISEEYKSMIDNPVILSMFSVKYILTSDRLNEEYILSANKNNKYFVKLFETSDNISIIENKNCLPRAFFVKNISRVSDIKEMKKRYYNDYVINPAETAFAEGVESVKNLNAGEIIAADYSDEDEINLIVRSGLESYLVLSDSYYPGWRAYINGIETTIYKTNGVSRGIFIKGSGVHKITFVFRPLSFFLGLGISLITLVFLVISIFIINKQMTLQR